MLSKNLCFPQFFFLKTETILKLVFITHYPLIPIIVQSISKESQSKIVEII